MAVERGWLVEAVNKDGTPKARPIFLSVLRLTNHVGQPSRSFRLTSSSDAALRFARERDAVALAEYIQWYTVVGAKANLAATEHEWS